MTWRTKRQLFILFLLASVAVVILAVITLPKIIVAPSCSDRKQNQDELGVDCGGSCALYCPSQIPTPDILWSRAFPTTDDVYNAVAYIENHAVDAATPRVPYEFRLYDADNILITRVEGTTAIMPNGPTAVFAGGISVGNRVPKRTTFAFTAAPQWVKLPQAVIARLDVSSSGTKMYDALVDPKLETTVTNNTLFSTGPFDVVAILYDAVGNAFGVSKTFVENMAPQSQQKLFMTWPRPFLEEPNTIAVVSLPNAYVLPQQ